MNAAVVSTLDAIGVLILGGGGFSHVTYGEMTPHVQICVIARGAQRRNPFNQKEPTAVLEIPPVFFFFFISVSDTKASELLRDSRSFRGRWRSPSVTVQPP